MSTSDRLSLETSTALVFAMHHNESDSFFQDIIYNKGVQASFCFVYAVIFLLGVFGNALVCYVVVRNKAMQTVTNLFITNLALSDILLCSLALPFTPLYTFLGEWIFGSILCHALPYTQGCSMYISTLTLTSIAVDRFFVIIYPFKPRMKISTCIWIIVSIWTFAVTVTFPYGYYMRIDGNKTDILFCEETWPSDEFKKAFGGLTLIMQFVLPFLMIAYCYTCVSIKLNNRLKSKPGTRREDADRERKRRTNRMLIAMVAIFGICWLPLNLINMFNDFYLPTAEWQFNFLFFFIAHTIAMSSTCYNPFLYAWLNENFRKEFKNVLPCFPSLAHNRKSQMNKLGNCRSEKTGNGNNDTMQETLLTSTTQMVPSVRYKLDMNATDSVENATNADFDKFVRAVKSNDSPELEVDCMKMYIFDDKTVGVPEGTPIVSQL